MSEINTHNLIVDFGKHNGTPYTRLPVGYLTWMVNSGHGKADIAQAELDRRGTTMPTLDISGHAIDRFSQHCLDIWDGKEGLHSWLLKMAREALDKGQLDDDGRILWKGIWWCFEADRKWPVLKTVFRK